MMTGLARNFSGLLLGAALASLPSSRAGAETASPTARTLFDLGRRLISQGRWAEACPKLEESLRLGPGMGTRFNLAYCWEHLGRTASAWSLYLDVAAAANAANLSERERIARRSAYELEPKLSYLSIDVAARARGLLVTRDGTPLGQAAWSTPTPVDPGVHHIRATAPGRRPWATTVNVPAAHVTYRVTVPVLSELPDTIDFSTPDWFAVGLGAGALAGVAAGTVLTGRLLKNRHAAERICPDYLESGCPGSDLSAQEHLLGEARTLRNQAALSFALGGAALTGSIIIFATRSSRADSRESVALRLEALPDAWGPCLHGSW